MYNPLLDKRFRDSDEIESKRNGDDKDQDETCLDASLLTGRASSAGTKKKNAGKRSIVSCHFQFEHSDSHTCFCIVFHSDVSLINVARFSEQLHCRGFSLATLENETDELILLVSSRGKLRALDSLRREHARQRAQVYLYTGTLERIVIDANNWNSKKESMVLTPAIEIILTDRLLHRLLSQMDLISSTECCFPIHDEAFNRKFMHAFNRSLWLNIRNGWYFWKISKATESDLRATEELRKQFGERVAFYFAFVSHYNRWLIPFGILGLLIFIAHYFPFVNWTYYGRAVSLLAFISVSVWAPLFLTSWQRQEATFRFLWGCPEPGEEATATENALNHNKAARPDIWSSKKTPKLSVQVENSSSVYNTQANRDAEGDENVDENIRKNPYDDGASSLSVGEYSEYSETLKRHFEINPITGRPTRHFDKSDRRRRVTCYVIIFSIFNLLLCMAIVLPFLQWYVWSKMAPTCDCCEHPNGPHCQKDMQEMKSCQQFINCFASDSSTIGTDRWVYILVQGIALGLTIDVFQTAFFEWATEKFVKMENWPTEAQRMRSLVRKQFAYMWVNWFFWFLFLAFVYVPFGDKLFGILKAIGLGKIVPRGGWRNGIVNLDQLFVTPLIVTQLLNLLLQTLVPTIKTQFYLNSVRRYRKISRAARRFSRRILRRGPYTPVTSIASKLHTITLENFGIDIETVEKVLVDGKAWISMSDNNSNELNKEKSLQFSCTQSKKDETSESNNSNNSSKVVEDLAVNVNSKTDIIEGDNVTKMSYRDTEINSHVSSSQFDSEITDLEKEFQRERRGKCGKFCFNLCVNCCCCNCFYADPEFSSIEGRDSVEILHEARQIEYSPHKDYLDIVIEFCYVTLFTSCWPLVPFCCMIKNALELRADAFKMLWAYRRAVPRRDNSIGEWFNAMRFQNILAIPVCCGLIVLATGQFTYWIPECANRCRDTFHDKATCIAQINCDWLENHHECGIKQEFIPDYDCIGSFSGRLGAFAVLEHLALLTMFILIALMAKSSRVLERSKRLKKDARLERVQREFMLPVLPRATLKQLRFIFSAIIRSSEVHPSEERISSTRLRTSPIVKGRCRAETAFGGLAKLSKDGALIQSSSNIAKCWLNREESNLFFRTLLEQGNSEDDVNSEITKELSIEQLDALWVLCLMDGDRYGLTFAEICLGLALAHESPAFTFLEKFQPNLFGGGKREIFGRGADDKNDFTSKSISNVYSEANDWISLSPSKTRHNSIQRNKSSGNLKTPGVRFRGLLYTSPESISSEANLRGCINRLNKIQ